MQSIRLLQAAALMLLVALAASCASTRDYTSKLFAPREAKPIDSSLHAIRFMETGDAETNTDDWVSTDLIMGRDSTGSSNTLDNFAKTFPAGKTMVPLKNDSTASAVPAKDTLLAKTPVPVEEPVTKAVTLNGKRNKKTRED